MNVTGLQQNQGERLKSALISAVLVLIALGSLLYVQSGERPQGSPPPQVRPSPAAQAQAPERPVLGPYRPPAPPVASSPAGAPWPPEGESVQYRSTFVQRLQYVAFVVAMLTLLLWATLRLLGQGTPGLALGLGGRAGRRKLVTVLERQTLGPGKGLVVVEVAGRHFLLGMSEQGITNLAELKAEEVLDSSEAPVAEGDPTSAGVPRNLIKEVLSQHLSALPGLNFRQKGS